MNAPPALPGPDLFGRSSEGGEILREDELYRCIQCGLCLEHCPTYLELGLETESPRGRIALMRATYEGRLTPTPDVQRHWDLCLGCRACEVACPSGVPYGRLIETTRAWTTTPTRRPLSERLLRRLAFSWLLPSPDTAAVRGPAPSPVPALRAAVAGARDGDPSTDAGASEGGGGTASGTWSVLRRQRDRSIRREGRGSGGWGSWPDA